MFHKKYVVQRICLQTENNKKKLIYDILNLSIGSPEEENGATYGVFLHFLQCWVVRSQVSHFLIQANKKITISVIYNIRSMLLKKSTSVNKKNINKNLLYSST